jgi:predicted CXXCH cytochrome family protein
MMDSQKAPTHSGRERENNDLHNVASRRSGFLRGRQKMNLKLKSFVQGLCCLSLGIMALTASCVPTSHEKKPEIRRTCAQCHPEKVAAYQTGVVHQPVKENNCEACHLPHGLVPTVLMRQPVPVVCLPCHAAFKEAASKKSLHEPVGKGKCESCHNPHNSEFPKLLKSAPEEVCFTCHDRKEFTKAKVHAPVKDGCGTCHDPHMADNPELLNKPSEALCASCHATDSGEFRTAHQGYPVTTRCVDCHTPHSSDEPGLLKKVVHSPVKSGDCDDCHQVEGSAITVKSPAGGLCLSCHDDVPAAAQHEPVKEGDCQTCHAEHASNYDGMLADSPAKICLQCHEQGRKKAGIKSVHAPAGKGECLSCHDGHAAPGKSMLKSDPPALCRRHQATPCSRQGRALP